MIGILIISASAGAAFYVSRRRARRVQIRREAQAQQEHQRLADSYNIRLLVYTSLLEKFPGCHGRPMQGFGEATGGV